MLQNWIFWVFNFCGQAFHCIHSSYKNNKFYEQRIRWTYATTIYVILTLLESFFVVYHTPAYFLYMLYAVLKCPIKICHVNGHYCINVFTFIFLFFKNEFLLFLFDVLSSVYITDKVTINFIQRSSFLMDFFY